VDVGSLNLQMIHQIDDVFRAAGAVRLGLVAQAVIAIVQRHHAMVGRQGRRDAALEEHPLGRVREPMDQNHPASAIAQGHVVNLDAIGSREIVVLGFSSRKHRGKHHRSGQGLHKCTHGKY